MARSQRQPLDQDRNVIISVSSVDGITPFPLEINPATGRLLVDATGGGSGGALNTQAKGVTTAGYPTSTTASADRQLLDVTLRDTSGNPLAVGGGSQYVEGVTTTPATGTVALGRFNTTSPTLTNGQLNAPQVDVNGNLKVNIAAGASSGAVAQGSSTTGQSGGLTQGAVTTTAPTYTTATTNPLSITTSGALRTDSTGTTQPVSMAINTPILQTGTNTVGNVRLSDGVTANLASIAPFHNSDNQGTSTGNAILTGGVAQLLNINGNLDRQRETGSDGISAIGVATGSAQFAMSYRGNIAAAITLSASPQIVTPTAMTGNVQGVPWSIFIGTVITTDTGTSLETVLVTAITSTTFTAIFTKNHAAGVGITGYVYNQERDAAGELDGATGAGTAVAVGYEYNGGHPDGIHNYDRERNLNAKGHIVQAITATTVGQTTITAATAPTGLEPGELILLSTANLATPEVAYVASNYVLNSTTIPLSAPLAVAGNTFLHFEQYAPNGPGLNGLLPFGIGIEEDVVYDPATGLFFIERAATQDAASGQNMPLLGLGLYNGATFDRARGDATNGAFVQLKTALPTGSNAIGSITNTTFAATQTTGTNLHTVTDSGSVTAATLSAETTKAIGVVRASDGAGNLLTSTASALDVNIKSGASSGTQYAEGTTTTPATGTVALGRYKLTAPTLTDGQMNSPLLDVNGNLKVNIAAGASSGAVAQASTTSGQTGGLTQAATTTAAPIYTTGTTNPLSTTLTGALRTDSSAITQPVSGTLTAVTSITNALPAGTNAIGSITNTSFAATQTTAANLNATIVGTGTLATQVTSLPALATGTNAIGSITNTSFTATQTTGTNLHTVTDTGSTTAVTALPSIPTGANAIGSITNTTFAVTQATASSLNATVVGNGTFATQVTSLPALATGANAIGSITNTSFISTQATAANLNATIVGTGTLATQVTSLPALATGANAIGSITNTSFIATQASGTNLHTVIDSGTISAVTAITNALPTGTNSIGSVGVIGTALVSQKAATSTSATLQAAAIATGNGTTISTDGMSAVVFTVSGTYVGTINFEGTEDGTNYTSISTTQLGTTIISSTTTSVGVFEASVAGLLNVRARLTWTSGTSVTVTAHAVPVNFATRTINANVVSQVALPTGTNTIGGVQLIDVAGTNKSTIKAASTAPIATDTALVTVESPNSPIVTNQTNGTQITKLSDGTNIANVLKSDGTAAGQNSQLVAGGYLSVPFTTTVAANVGSTDVGDYRSVSVQINTQGTGSTVNFQTSNDNTNWTNTVLGNANSSAATANTTNTTSVGTLYYGNLTGRYFRISVTGITALTTAGQIIFSTLPTSFAQINGLVAQSGTWTVGSNSATGIAAPTTAFYMATRSLSGNLNGIGDLSTSSDANSGFSQLMTGTYGFNGTTYDRSRNNTSGAIIAAGATTAQTSTTQITYNAKRLHAVINISAFTSGTLTFTINAITASGYTYPLLISTALASTGTTVLKIFDGATPTANLTANDSIPRSFNVVVSGTFVATYGVDYGLGV